jgi:hypothetical protein
MNPLGPRLTPGKKAQRTARWARTMTKWLITFNHRKGARWNIVGFGGKANSEARGIVDLLAIRKDHQRRGHGLERGDLFEIVIIQVKGGASRRPTRKDVARLLMVAEHHRARAVVLAEWQRGMKLDLFKLEGGNWKPVAATDVFG